MNKVLNKIQDKDFFLLIFAAAVVGFLLGIWFDNFTEVFRNDGIDDNVKYSIVNSTKEYLYLIDESYDTSNFENAYNFKLARYIQEYTGSLEEFKIFFNEPMMKLSFDNIERIDFVDWNKYSGNMIIATLIITNFENDKTQLKVTYSKTGGEWVIFSFETRIVELKSKELQKLLSYPTE